MNTGKNEHRVNLAGEPEEEINTGKNEHRVNLGGDTEDETENASNDNSATLSDEKQIYFEEEINKLKNKLLLALADNQNLIKSHRQIKEREVKFAAESALKELVIPFESLCSSIKVEVPDGLKDNDFIKSMIEGQILIQKKFEQTFEKIGLTRFYPLGEKFNPDFHSALSKISDETKEKGTVVEVVSSGFILNGKVIKYAEVIVVE